MGSLLTQEQTHWVDHFFSKNAYTAFFSGILATIAAQSSSIITALLVPLAGTGVLTLRAVYPVTVGANIGTTCTALLAAMTGNMAGLAIALVHLIFNVLGALLFFIIPFMRPFSHYLC